jgi:uncharacterized protein involved in outer membrane biogenesis
MNRWLKLLAICAGVVVALIAASGLLLRSIVNGSGKDRVVASLGAKLGAPVSVGSVNFDLKQWFHLRPAIALNDVAIGNPPGFSNGPLLQAKKISAQVALAPLLHRRIEVDSIQVDQPQITVENDKNGNSNVEALVKKASGGGAGANSAQS